MPRFIKLTRIEAVEDEDGNPDLEYSDVLVNTDYITYVESRVVHLVDGTTFLCTIDEEKIARMLTQN